MGFSIEDFSRKRSLDLETAIAAAVARRLAGAVFPGPLGQGTIRLDRVFSDWPSFEDEQLAAAACVLPDAPLVYDESQTVPYLLEETWEPVGQPGFGIYVLSEATRDLEVVFRAGTQLERDAIKAGVEELFFRSGTTAIPGTARYGVVDPMPEYYGMPVRVSLAETQKLDDEDKAARNAWDFRALLRCQARHVKVDVVRPFALRVEELVEDETGP